MSTSRGVSSGLLACTALTLAASGLSAQDQAPMSIHADSLRPFAAAFLQIEDSREEFNNILARTHEAQGKAEVREAFDLRVAEILAAHGLTEEIYERFTLIISVDETQRRAFQAALADLKAGRGGFGSSPPNSPGAVGATGHIQGWT